MLYSFILPIKFLKSTHTQMFYFIKAWFLLWGKEPRLYLFKRLAYLFTCSLGYRWRRAFFLMKKYWKQSDLSTAFVFSTLKTVAVCGFVLFLMEHCWSWFKNLLVSSILWRLKKELCVLLMDIIVSQLFSLILSLFHLNAFKYFWCTYIHYFYGNYKIHWSFLQEAKVFINSFPLLTSFLPSNTSQSLQVFHCHLKTKQISFNQIWNKEKTKNSQKERKEGKKEKARRGTRKEKADTDSRISGRRVNGPHYPKSKTSVLSMCACVYVHECVDLYNRWVYVNQPRSVSARLLCAWFILYVSLISGHTLSPLAI